MLKNKLNSKLAFTLIELLVVIAIIGLLATVSVIALNNARSKSRDAKRVSEIKQILTALELYYNDQNRYPLTAEFISGEEIFSTSSYGTTTYLAHIPTAPTPADGACSDSENLFTYTSNDGSSYSLTFCLGVNTGTLTAGVNNANPYGITYLNPGSEDAGCPACAECEATSTPSGCSCDDANFPCCANCNNSATCQGGTYCGRTANCSGSQICSSGTCIDFLCGTSQVPITVVAGHTCTTGDLCLYDTVLIGTQCWFKQNLNVGSMVTGVTAQTSNNILEKYCYSNNSANCTTYGALYQWDEAMQYTEASGAQGICPTGWHIPTDTEQNTLDQYLNDTTCNASRAGTFGCSAAGSKLKEAGTSHWTAPNTGATNSSGFTALPAGYREADGSFVVQGIYGSLWSSSISETNSWCRYLDSGSTTVLRRADNQAFGFSIRCLKDQD
ncbi:MAG: FISUMP domain-containing protein [Patescibacteria group bacterium]